MIAVCIGLNVLLWSLGIPLWRGRASLFPDIPGFTDSFPGSADKSRFTRAREFSRKWLDS
jgi:hypothetical protein